MLPQSHSSLHVTYAREPAFSLMLDELVQGAQVVKKLFFFFLSFPNFLTLGCFVQHWYWDRKIRLEEGVLVKPCWQRCSAAPTLKLEKTILG